MADSTRQSKAQIEGGHNGTEISSRVDECVWNALVSAEWWLTFLRTDTVSWIPSCTHDTDRYCDNITLYVVRPSSFKKCTNISPALLLAGCSSSSPLIPGIFLISIYYQQYSPVPSTAQVDFNVHNAIAVIAGDAKLQCRVGYFGICINPDGGSWLCSNNATALANEISLTQDPLNLIWLASQFKDMIVFPYLM